MVEDFYSIQNLPNVYNALLSLKISKSVTDRSLIQFCDSLVDDGG